MVGFYHDKKIVFWDTGNPKLLKLLRHRSRAKLQVERCEKSAHAYLLIKSMHRRRILVRTLQSKAVFNIGHTCLIGPIIGPRQSPAEIVVQAFEATLTTTTTIKSITLLPWLLLLTRYVTSLSSVPARTGASSLDSFRSGLGAIKRNRCETTNMIGPSIRSVRM